MSSELSALDLYDRGERLSIVRHNGGANTSYLDGHVRFITSENLLSKNYHFDYFWRP